MWGLWISLAGCVTLVAINVIFIPTYGYMACAWAGVAGYGVSMLLSYFLGQKYNPTNYPLKEIGVYVGMTALFFVGMHYYADFIEDLWLRLLVNTGLIGAYGAHVVYHEFLKKRKVKIS
jgi:O-antigen/teichoic acid export membrane protein